MSAFLLGIPGKVKTLLDRLTAARAGYLDRLDATVSSRAAAATALSTAQWTNALATALGKVGTMGLLVPPKAGGLVAGRLLDYSDIYLITDPSSFTTNAAALGIGAQTATTNSATYVDAVNYTGSGYVDFLAFIGGTTRGIEFDIIIDGVTVLASGSADAYKVALPVGSMSFANLWDAAGNATRSAIHTAAGCPVVFYASLQIRHRRNNTTGSGTPDVATMYRVVKTS